MDRCETSCSISLSVGNGAMLLGDGSSERHLVKYDINRIAKAVDPFDARHFEPHLAFVASKTGLTL